MTHTLSPTDNDLADFEMFIAGQIANFHEPDRSDLECYLRAHPGHSLRDWKGKSAVHLSGAAIGEKPWSSLKPVAVRELATGRLARDLPLNVRQAAARDPELVWNPLARKYRLRVPGDPSPTP